MRQLLAMALLGGVLLPARAEHATIALRVMQLDAATGMSKGETIAKADAEPPLGGLEPRPLLKVKVDKINIMNVRGKVKRLGRFSGRRSDWKKALVTLKEGEKLEMYESA